MERSQERPRAGGYSLSEIAITLAIISVAVALAVPSLNRTRENNMLRDTATALDGGLSGARGEAMRTGDVHLFFLMQDADGNALVDQNGEVVPALILNDGAPGSPNQNCHIDDGEEIKTISRSEATEMLSEVMGAPGGGQAPGDEGGGVAMSAGSSFVDPQGNPATWVMFRPEGMPIAFDNDCNLGGPGSGAGAFYMKNENRAYAVMLSPMGTTKVKIFNETTGGWE
jgi:Tfp pilus assembly protein FimT